VGGMSNKKISLNIGGKWAISWKITFYFLPFLVFIVPIAEGAFTSWWAFWRWSFVSVLSLIPLLVIFLFADVTVFKDRERNPLPAHYVFILGFFLGLVRGFTAGILAINMNLLTLDGQSNLAYVIIRGVNAGLLGMLTLPLISLIASSIEVYQDDRNALIAERMLHQSQKSESMAVIKSLRSAMTRKVDANLLKVIKDSQEYIDEKGRSLEKNWELMAVKLRKAALDTIRPFSHQLHRQGEEKVYKVRGIELIRYVSSIIKIEIAWVLLGYLVLNFRFIFEYSPTKLAILNITSRILLIYVGLMIIKSLKRSGRIRSLITYLPTLLLFVVLFGFATHEFNRIFQLPEDSELLHVLDSVFLFFLVIIIGFISSFLYGQHAESTFLERQLSKEQLEAMLLKREEDRLSRELAKYLHGTIQSRLMASAMALEKAGRKGDKRALEKELAQAYESLRVPSASYFAAPEDSFKAEISKVNSKWNNLLNIKVKIDKTIGDLEPAKSQEIGNAINEGLSNAFRHGGATNVKLDIQKVKSGISIEMIDDGQGPLGGKGGLGTEWFNAIAGRSWSLKKVNAKGGAVLELFISN
jgi:two-component sensor histidine kinase